MSSSKHLVVAVLLLVAVVGLGAVAVVWPYYRDTAEINRQAKELRLKAPDPKAHEQEMAQLRAESQELAGHKTGLKKIPASKSADVAGLIGLLSLPADGVNVFDQTFLRGEPKEAVPGTDSPYRAQPLTIDMQARFDAIFRLMQMAESQDRLLRVTSVSIVAERRGDENQPQGQPLAKATVVVEAIYEPPRAEEH